MFQLYGWLQIKLKQIGQEKWYNMCWKVKAKDYAYHIDTWSQNFGAYPFQTWEEVYEEEVTKIGESTLEHWDTDY